MTFALSSDNIGLQSVLLKHLKEHFIKPYTDVTNFVFWSESKIAEQAVLEGRALVSVHFLSNLPTTRNEGLRIGAVLPRMQAGYTLCIPKNYADDTKNLKLPDAPIIGVNSIFEAKQLLDFRNDITFLYKDMNFLIQSCPESAVLLPNFVLSHTNTENSILIPLDKSELVPPPAQGVIALQYNKYDTDTEDILRRLHCKKTLSCCNIEREAQQIIGDEAAKNRLGVYCEADENGNYHSFCVWADEVKNTLDFFKISQNTRHNFAKAIAKKALNFA